MGSSRSCVIGFPNQDGPAIALRTERAGTHRKAGAPPMSTLIETEETTLQAFANLKSARLRIKAELGKVIVGHEQVID